MSKETTRALALMLPTPVPGFRASLAAQGASVGLDGTEPAPVILGTGPASALALRGDTVSRRHCSVELADGALRVVDLGSTNGTRIDGVRVECGFARDGSVLDLGGVQVAVSLQREARKEVPRSTRFGCFLGMSTEIRRLHPLLERIAASRVATLIEGETGTGKEILAQALHEQGPRARRPFVVVDCTTIPENLAESELFGHEKGAFTGATARKTGAFEQADTGTIFLDEIGDLPLPLQAKLLRVIDRGELHPVGSSRWQKVDVRVLAATRRDLDQEVAHGRFRDDLYHRLVVARVALPPLRERRGDVAFLVREFCVHEGFAPDSLPPELVASWSERRWPGNVRELRAAVQRYLALGVDPAPEANQAPGSDFLGALLREALPLPEARRRLMEEFERRYIAAALARSAGNVSAAARASGVARRHFQNLKARAGDEDEDDLSPRPGPLAWPAGRLAACSQRRPLDGREDPLR